ncbi:hypothetical protein GCM10007160_27420 [Litchfieldella qijiaojingensis]|uniref:Uncharacterized protein n=1 Tax=Litchfieldella qijiaojingensis TaxID=980347 RepID=A0ABQ2YXD9_9GAMM|nr:hypothetical protein [Halomonas qijiaojingensis]GGX98407.1 hypothetical protein GCM10007160_27420 [Halomonas qijiaojingensis]
MNTLRTYPGNGRAFRLPLFLALLFASGAIAVADGGADLTFQGDASFNGPHGDQAIQVALVNTDTGEVVARESGTVSGADDPAFSFTFADALKADTAYEVHYWIDSNFGGGSAGSCDPSNNDHQWRVALDMASEAVTHTESHDPSRLGDVCDTFAGAM